MHLQKSTADQLFGFPSINLEVVPLAQIHGSVLCDEAEDHRVVILLSSRSIDGLSRVVALSHSGSG